MSSWLQSDEVELTMDVEAASRDRLTHQYCISLILFTLYSSDDNCQYLRLVAAVLITKLGASQEEGIQLLRFLIKFEWM